MTTVLIGGGRGDLTTVLTPFFAAAPPSPAVGCVLLADDGDADGFTRWSEQVQDAGPCQPVHVPVDPHAGLDMGALAGCDALFVCGGLTPAYAAALVPAGPALRSWLGAGRPYAGISAGAAVAPAQALVGGWQVTGRAVCPPDTAEDLEEVTVVDGLGLVDIALDVHAAQWGTLGRLVAAVTAGLLPVGVALDEGTALWADSADPGSLTVIGSGAAHVVRPLEGGAKGAAVESLATGSVIRT